MTIKRSKKIGLLLVVLVVLVLGIGLTAYKYQDRLRAYLFPPETGEKYEAEKPREIPEEEAAPPGEEVPPQKIPPAEVAPEQLGRVVFMGDSITYRWDMPAEIAGYQAVNSGKNGDTTAAMLLRFDEDVIELEPEQVFILGGINDLLISFQYDLIVVDLQMEKSAENIRLMTKLAKKAGIDPVLCSVLPVAADFHLPPAEVNQAVKRLNSSIRKIAGQEKVKYLDLWPMVADPQTQMLKSEYASQDGIHLNEQGYELIQNVFTQLLT